MTIVTKTVLNPKSDKVQSFPLVDEKCTVSVDVKDGDDTGSNTPATGTCKVCGISGLRVLYSTALLVLVLYIIYMCGAFLSSSEDTSVQNYREWAEIPMPQYQDPDLYKDDGRIMPADNRLEDFMSQIFKELIEIDLLNERYEKIDVPDFKGMKGRFIHDFNVNFSAIIDPSTQRCFIMPLNRTAILPPKSLRDAITKMQQGYYEVDMSVVKQNYKAVFPAVADFGELGQYIANECSSLSTYRLEKITRDVFKRSAPGNRAVFTQYAGKAFQEIVVSNIADVEDYEKNHS